MSVSSIPFFLFFALIVVLYYLLAQRRRWIVLLVGSYGFALTYRAELAAILAGITLVTFFFAKQIAAAANRATKRCWMWTGIVASLAVLFLFKYTGFAAESLNALATILGLTIKVRGLDLIYPVGLSFLVFQVIGYLVDVTNGKVIAENHLGYYAVYNAFFPRLLMGPIERYSHFAPQLRQLQPFSAERFVEGGLRIAWGLFKKLVVANRLAILVNTVFAAPQNFSSVQLLFAVFSFSFQVYVDFASYCDIALGAAKMLGFNLAENFHHPYMAQTVTEFWRRWHISLSNWLRDYVFIPLNFKHRRKKPALLWQCFDVMITFLISGLWHGANWSFIAWGFFHGLFQSVELLIASTRVPKKAPGTGQSSTIAQRWLKRLGMFLLVSFTWVFFRADSVRQGYGILRFIWLMENLTRPEAWLLGEGLLGLPTGELMILLHGLVGFLLLEYLQSRSNLYGVFRQQPVWFRWISYFLLIFSFLLFGVYAEASTQQFIYFQF
ncbi:MAG: MBOAT family protein [Anaerolineae bacterium]|nr:MBOAT family protein [Anaerolineae bacterium]